MTKSQMFATHSNLVTELLKSPFWNAFYAGMTDLNATERLAVLGGSGTSTSGEELQVIQYKCVHRHRYFKEQSS